MSEIEEIISLLLQLEQDETIPKNIRIRITNTKGVLRDNSELGIKIDKSLQELDEIAEDPNVPSYARTQIWNIVSLLESNRK